MSSQPQSSTQEVLAGLVERVTFHSPDTGYAVLRVLPRGKRGIVTVVGSVPSITAGEVIEARGAWVIDPQHGEQFRADELRTLPPSTVEGIEKYLGSGLVEGIGPTDTSPRTFLGQKRSAHPRSNCSSSNALVLFQ